MALRPNPRDTFYSRLRTLIPLHPNPPSAPSSPDSHRAAALVSLRGPRCRAHPPPCTHHPPPSFCARQSTSAGVHGAPDPPRTQPPVPHRQGLRAWRRRRSAPSPRWRAGRGGLRSASSVHVVVRFRVRKGFCAAGLSSSRYTRSRLVVCLPAHSDASRPWKPILSATGYMEYYFDSESGKVCRI